MEEWHGNLLPLFSLQVVCLCHSNIGFQLLSLNIRLSPLSRQFLKRLHRMSDYFRTWDSFFSCPRYDTVTSPIEPSLQEEQDVLVIEPRVSHDQKAVCVGGSLWDLVSPEAVGQDLSTKAYLWEILASHPEPTLLEGFSPEKFLQGVNVEWLKGENSCGASLVATWKYTQHACASVLELGNTQDFLSTSLVASLKEAIKLWHAAQLADSGILGLVWSQLE